MGCYGCAPRARLGDTAQVAQLVASAVAEATDRINEQQEKRVRLLVLGLSGLAALFGVYRAIVPACRR